MVNTSAYITLMISDRGCTLEQKKILVRRPAGYSMHRRLYVYQGKACVRRVQPTWIDFLAVSRPGSGAPLTESKKCFPAFRKPDVPSSSSLVSQVPSFMFFIPHETSGRAASANGLGADKKYTFHTQTPQNATTDAQHQPPVTVQTACSVGRRAALFAARERTEAFLLAQGFPKGLVDLLCR